MLILFYLLISILGIILLSTKFKLNPAISLFIGGIILGALLKIGLLETLTFQVMGLINSLKGIGLIIFFSCIIGQILKESNSIKRFGNIILNSFQNKSLFSLNILGLLIGTVVFCDSAFLILNGISRSIASSSSLSLSSLNPSLEPSHAFAEAIKIAPKLSKETILIVNSCGDALKDRDILRQRLGKLK